jgi:alanine dehydrogenase
VAELVASEVAVVIETGAGDDSSITDDDFRAAGAEISSSADDTWGRADLVLKVKEPQASEFSHLRPDLTLFTYLHLAAYPAVAEALLEKLGGDSLAEMLPRFAALRTSALPDLVMANTPIKFWPAE